MKENKMKRSITACLIMLTLASLSNIASADIANGGFEYSLNGWTPYWANDGSNLGYDNGLMPVSDYHHSGEYSLWGYAQVTSDYLPEEDWSRSCVWSEPQDLSGAASIQLYLTVFQSNTPLYSWGYGQEVFLMLDDGTNQAAAVLADNHEPVYDSLIDRGLYTTSTGNDGRNWYGFDVLLNADYFDGFSDLDLSNTKIGICWEALNWNTDSFQNLWVGAAVDDIQVVPEPATICLLGLGGLLLSRGRRLNRK